MITPLAVLGLVVDRGSLDLNLSRAQVALEVS